MLEAKEGYRLHNIAGKPDSGGWYSFTRKDAKRGVMISYLATEPLMVQVPVEEEVQATCLANYSTNIGGEKVMGAVGAIARFSLHDLESLFGGMKSALPDGGELDDPETIQAKVMAWVPWTGNGGRKAKPTVSESRIEELREDPEALMAYLATIATVTV